MVVVDMFKKNPLNSRAASRRKLIYGVGINDSDYNITHEEHGTTYVCEYYRKWHSMLKRAYSKSEKLLFPSYIGVTVCSEWHRFSAFRDWMITQNYEGLELDKDLLLPGNKVYCPEYCCFITQALNSALLKHESSRGLYPQGVTKPANRRKYQAHIKMRGKPKYLGTFNTPEEAAAKYNAEKASYIESLIEEQTDERIANGLRLHAQLYLEGKVI